jgi:hypothetical protein
MSEKDSETPDGMFVPPGLADQIADQIRIVNEFARAWGLPEPEPASRRTRLRWRIAAIRYAIARFAYRIITGYDVPEKEEW